MSAKPRCACGKVAKFLCDALVDKPRDVALQEILAGESGVTCDRPLCEGCRVEVGVTFACGAGGGIDSMDRCPEHSPYAGKLLRLR